MKKIVGTFVLATAVMSASAFAQQKAPEPFVSMSDSTLKWVPGRFPGSMTAPIVGAPNEPGFYMTRTKFAPNTQIPSHTHPNTEHLTVLSGTFYMGQGDKLDESKAEAIKAGGVVVIQAKVPHFAFTKEETVIQQKGIGPTGLTFLDPKDNPAKN